MRSGWKSFLLLGVFCLTSFRVLKPLRVVIDAGHGGKDPGASGKVYKEKDITLAVALKLAASQVSRKPLRGNARKRRYPFRRRLQTQL